MTIREIAERTEAVVYADPDRLDEDLTGAFGSDMMSDVLAFAENRDVLLTEEIKRLAQLNDIVLMETKMTMYEASGRLYEGGLGR